MGILEAATKSEVQTKTISEGGKNQNPTGLKITQGIQVLYMSSQAK